ncbi:Na+/H+ antiporter NhaA [Planctomicrobium sp. SH527]|uniref:Na+/H+ antiporter NhaA n=1 Tax=Planctomicrobium sp. SH527 TaxID=3448123 RepID=UPI003F5B94D6
MLKPPVDIQRDHIIGPPDAEMVLVQYGSYACARNHAVHDVIERLRSRFGNRMCYVFRHLPRGEIKKSRQAAEFTEFAGQKTGKFWEIHEAVMERGPGLSKDHLNEIAQNFDLPSPDEIPQSELKEAQEHIQTDIENAQQSGATTTPAFFINGRRYDGAWDESSLADAMLGTLGHRIQSAAFSFVGWGPSSGLLLGLATLIALLLSNSPLGPAVSAWWETPLGIQWGTMEFSHSLLHWVNHGLLTIFFFVVGLEIKREFTVGHLSSFRAGALPVISAFGGILIPAGIYALVAPPELRHGWGIPIGTDTAFAVAMIVLLRDRVPIELRVFLTAAVIIDDIVAIIVIALFYSGEINTAYLIASGVVTALVLVLNGAGVYRTLPYLACAVAMWFLLHEAGLHATLAGVIMAVLIPARSPAKLPALLAQAATLIHREDEHKGEAMRSGPSESALLTLDAIYSRIESPTDKLLRTVEPWSSYVVLPIFALANAGVAWSMDAFEGNGRLMAAIILGLVIGKPAGLVAAAWLAVKSGIAVKPNAYSWRQLCGAGALGGIGFTMSLFISDLAFTDAGNQAASKIAIFIASIIAGALGTIFLWVKPEGDETPRSTKLAKE